MNQGDNGVAQADATESQESIYARNRAIYEASLSAAQQSQAATNGNGNLPAIIFNKQARPRSSSPDKGTPDTATDGDPAGQPARKKLVKAGDLNTQTNPQETRLSADSPSTPTASTPSQQESMREKIARATRGGSLGSPAMISSNAFSPNNLQQLRPSSSSSSNPSSNPFIAQPTYSPPSNGQGEMDQVIEVNARAFVSKNPGVPIAHVKSALKHSKGVFDQNFTTAMKLLMQSHPVNNGQPPKSVSPTVPPGGLGGPQVSNANPGLPQQGLATSAPPSARYPGQNSAPQQSPPYPGSAAFQTIQQQQQQQGNTSSQQQQPARISPGQQQLYPHQMNSQPTQGGGQAQSINGQSAAALVGQSASQNPVGHSAQSSASGQTMMQPPPPLLPGTHPQLGFSALQVLPQNQHAQFLQLAPIQQIEYSASVFASLLPEQKTQYTVQAQAQARMRESWNRQQQQNGGMVVIHPGGRGAGSTQAPNPYVGYATQLPTQQQQMQQQRFPGQNPVFRVGAPQPSGSQQPISQQQATAQHNAYLTEQYRVMLGQLMPQQRAQVLALSQEQQVQWVHEQLRLRIDHQKRTAQQQARVRQQQMMADKHQEHKQTKTIGGKKKRRRNYSDSDDEDDLNLHDTSDEDNDDEDINGGDGSEAEGEREAKGVQWFNTTSVEELMEMTGCNAEAAAVVIEMRPYANPGEIRGKFRKRKGVSGNMFDNYVDLMHSYGQTDECLESCAGIGKELERILSIWTGGKEIAVTESMRPSAEPEEVKPELQLQANVEEKVNDSKANEAKVERTAANLLKVPSAGPSTRTSTPALGPEATANVGASLVEMSQDVLQLSKKQDASQEIKYAFEGYLYEQPKLMQEGVELKGYQMLGVNWLKLLYSKQISCILADEMGLGKTIQVIAFLAHLKETDKPGPHLIIVPSSTLDNWIREFEKFSPSLKVFAYYGNQAERADSRFFLKQQKDLDVIVTTYNMATGAADDRKFLRKMEFKACVFDEGHQLKNSESKKYKDLMEIKVQWRLLLTGTPLQNNLQELVSLLSFILPKIFLEAQDSLRAIFKVPPDAHKNLLTRQRVRAAKQVMTPFVLRRKKAQVLQDLPQKIELIEYCEMTPGQRDIYRETLEKHKRAVVDYAPSGTATPVEDAKPDAKPPVKKRGRAAAKTGKAVQENSTSNVLMALRKAANHPMLFRRLYDDKKIKQMAKECLKEEEFVDRNVDFIYEDMDLMTDFELHRFVQPYKHLSKFSLKKEEWMDAGKVKKLMTMLPEIKSRGDRVLIFSQFVSVLDILAQVLETMGLRYLTLTGQTNVNDRQGLVDEFTEDEDITCFLLSTRAGGLGLNLMAANIVIIMDMDFNPHNDKQAQDRAYRMGQTKEVTIYKFVTRGTIEEDMLALADTKLALDEQVSAESAVSGELAQKLEIDDGAEGLIEKKVKASLMSTLQKRWSADDTEYQQTQAAAPIGEDDGIDGVPDGDIPVKEG